MLEVIGSKLAGSVWLLVLAWVFSGLLGFCMGVLAGAFQDRWPDKLIKGWSMLIASTPAFWLALLLLMVFGVWLGWLPIGLSVPIGMESAAVTLADRLRHAVLPALAQPDRHGLGHAAHPGKAGGGAGQRPRAVCRRPRGEQGGHCAAARGCGAWRCRP